MGISYAYRLFFYFGYLAAALTVVVWGYNRMGSGWLLVGWPFAMIAGLMTQGVLMRAFPPKLEPFAEGETWLKLN